MAALEDLIRETSGMQGYIAAQMSDEFFMDYWPMQFESLDGKEDKILEIRVFNEDKEVKLFRGSLEEELKIRIIEDPSALDEESYYDEFQFLDIDVPKTQANFSQDHMAWTTTSGCFRLPMNRVTETSALKVRYYFGTYEQTGQSYICDWRAVTLMEACNEL